MVQAQSLPRTGQTAAAPRLPAAAWRDVAAFGRDAGAVEQRPLSHDHLHRPDEFLRLIESHGLTGAWTWHFTSDEQVWSPGCFHLLGLDPREARPSYELLLGLVHPGDRFAMPRASDLKRGEIPSSQTFRIIRPDGTTRILRSRSEVKLGLDGRARSALGTLFDVTDRERDLLIQASHRRSLQALDRQAGILRFSMAPNRSFDFEPAAVAVLGRSLGAINADPFVDADPRDRDALYGTIADRQATGGDVHRPLKLWRVGVAPLQCQLTMVAAVPGQPHVEGWHGLLQILGGTTSDEPANNASAPDETLSGAHLRAARALLDWSMADLASASGLSLSTIRRVEADDPSRPVRSRRAMVSALCRAGVEFRPLCNGRVAVSCIG